MADSLIERTERGLRRRAARVVSGVSTRIEAPSPTSRRPRITVIVLCYKYGRYLPGAVDSVLGQEGVDTDVIIVDDASPDDSGSIAAALAAEDPRVRALLLERNLGPVAAYNRALPEVQGDYVVRLDADDELTPGALARAAALLEAHAEVGFVYGRPRNFHGDEVPAGETGTVSWSTWSGTEWLQGRCDSGFNCMTSPEVVMRTALHRRLGGQRHELGHTHDMEMWLRAAVHADVGRIDNADQALIRIHGDSRMRTLYTSHLSDLDERWRAFQLSLGGGPAGTVEADLLRSAARTLLIEACDHLLDFTARGKKLQDDESSYSALIDELSVAAGDAAAPMRLRRRLDRVRSSGAARCVATIAALRRALWRRVLIRYWRWTGL